MVASIAPAHGCGYGCRGSITVSLTMGPDQSPAPQIKCSHHQVREIMAAFLAHRAMRCSSSGSTSASMPFSSKRATGLQEYSGSWRSFLDRGSRRESRIQSRANEDQDGGGK